jgi:PAS domain S-box-containing protein
MGFKPEDLGVVFDHLYDGIYIVDMDRCIQHWNRAAEAITGYGREEVIGRHCWEDILVHLDGEGRSLCKTNRCPAVLAMNDGEVHEAVVYLQHKLGHRVPVETRVIPLGDKEPHTEAVEIFRDISPLAALLSEVRSLRDRALLDPLTQMGNRRYMARRLGERLDELRRYEASFGVLLFAIAPGGGVRNVVNMVALTLLNCMRKHDVVGRWADDAFLAIVSNVGEAQLKSAAERCGRIVKEAVGPAGPQISVGGALAQPGDTPDSLEARARQQLRRISMNDEVHPPSPL